MLTLPAVHTRQRASELLPPLAAHRLLTILAGDAAPAPEGDPADALARFIIRQGWGRLAAGEAAAGAGPLPWFVRVTFPGIPPPDPFIVAVATAAGLRVESLADAPSAAASANNHSGAAGDRHTRWLLVSPQSREHISSAVARLRATHRIHAVPFRQIED